MLNKFLKLSAISSGLMLAFGLSACTDTKTAAGGTEAESTIALQIQLADGTPAAKTRVRLLSESYLSDGITSAEWNLSDEEGYVEFKVDEPGSYTVEARRTTSDEAVGAISYVTLESAGTVVDSMELGELTTIEGYVAAGQGPSVVRIAGIDRFIVPDSSGKYVIDSLPLGNFQILVESRSNRGSVTLQANAGETVPEVTLGVPRGFAVENFESFSGQSASGAILGDGWWYTLDAAGENLLPLWDENLTKTYSGSEGCVSGGCARVAGVGREGRLGFLLGQYKKDYVLPRMDTLMFSARGKGKLQVSLSYGDDSSTESGLTYEVELSKVWQGYAIAVADMKKYGNAKKNSDTIIVSRIDFKVSKGDTLFLDDVFLGGVDKKTLESVTTAEKITTVYSTDWKDHDALIAETTGYAKGVRGGAGPVGESKNIGEICVVTTTDDYLIVEDTTVVDDSISVSTNAVVAAGSLRECATKDTSTWIVFEKSGTYELKTPLRLTSNKTIDGRGRDIRITGMGVLTDGTTNVIFENLTFTSPAITVQDTSSRRAISIHNLSNYFWVDHCTFEEYPLIELDVKRGSQNVTVSWSRFENAQTGILFGLPPDMFVDSIQTLTMHHNYFANMSFSGVYARGGFIHAYNNFFMGLEHYGVECSDSAHCYIENNIFNDEDAVVLYRLWDDKGPVESTVGFVNMKNNWYANGGEDLEGDARGYVPEYKIDMNLPDADLAWKIKAQAGPR